MQLHFLDVDRDRAQVQAVWCSLLAEENHAYFLSWAWVENWLTTALARGTKVKLGVIEDAHGPVTAFFMGGQRALRHGFVPSRTLFLNTTGRPEIDRIYLEFNALPKRADAVLSLPKLLKILPGAWDELVFAGLDREMFPGNAIDLPLAGYRLEIKRDTPARYVDLTEVRRSGAYLDLLSANTRAQIRRSRRLYAERGEVRLAQAESLSEAETIFEELLDLHRRMWAVRNERSNFDTDYVLTFHRRLIQQRFSHGEIQLLRFTVGPQTVGCLYNFIYAGRVYAYQSGFRFEPDNRLKPGLACHCAAIEHNAHAGLKTYELLAGEGQYKSSLGTEARQLVWCRLQKPRLQFWLERQARRLRQRLRQPAIAGEGEV